jgi:hypothetical protein
MPSSSPRPRRPWWVLLVALLLICYVVPRARYAMDVALLDLRYSGLVLLLLGAFIWILVKLAPRNRK